MQQRILIVDDEQAITDVLAVYLKNEGFEVLTAYDGNAALRLIDREELDLAILDIMLPGIDGYALCQHIRKWHIYPIILLTAKEEEIDQITGLSLGADDYVTKPFRPLEIVARVKAQLRRYTRYNTTAVRKDNDLIVIRGLSLDPNTHECRLNERPVELTPKEFAILHLLCTTPGKVLSAEELFERVWGEKYLENSSNTVMVHIRHLREKLGDSADKPRYIKTIWGVGYRIEK